MAQTQWFRYTEKILLKFVTIAVETFQHNDRCRFLVGNPTVGGYGLTLTAARHVIYFSNSYNLEVRQQSEDRAHRHGQTGQVTIIDIIARDTIDEMVLALTSYFRK